MCGRNGIPQSVSQEHDAFTTPHHLRDQKYSGSITFAWLEQLDSSLSLMGEQDLGRLWRIAPRRILSCRSDDVGVLDRHAEGDTVPDLDYAMPYLDPLVDSL